MNCDWQDIPNSADDRGWRKVRCSRCSTDLKGHTPHPFEKIYRDCLAWPRSAEWGYWAALFLEVFGLSKHRWRWLRWQLGFVEPCRCEERERWLNSLPGRIVQAWRWLAGTPPREPAAADPDAVSVGRQEGPANVPSASGRFQ